MKYAIISDIHGNIEALKAVMNDIKRRGIDKIVCLGDIVGYYPNPEACVKIVRKKCSYCVAGNHDHAAAGLFDYSSFTLFAFVAMEWTIKHLSKKSKDFLKSLPITIKNEHMLCTHASPSKPGDFTKYVFEDNNTAVREAFSNLTHKVNFIGHTHSPSIMILRNGKIIHHTDTYINLNSDDYYIINTGSVGQPRNFDVRSSYAIFDVDSMRVELRTVEYNYAVTQNKIIKRKLPYYLASRLENGR